MAGLLVANARRERLKFFLRTKRKFQLGLGTWSVLSCEEYSSKSLTKAMLRCERKGISLFASS